MTAGWIVLPPLEHRNWTQFWPNPLSGLPLGPGMGLPPGHPGHPSYPYDPLALAAQQQHDIYVREAALRQGLDMQRWDSDIDNISTTLIILLTTLMATFMTNLVTMLSSPGWWRPRGWSRWGRRRRGPTPSSTRTAKVTSKIFMMMEIVIMVTMILLIMLVFLGNKDYQGDVELYCIAQKSLLDPLSFGFFLPSSTFWTCAML